MSKMLRAIAVTAALMLGSAFASAATTVNLTGSGNHYTGGFTVTHTDDFTDTFYFSPEFPSALVSASLITIGFSATEDITFNTVTLNGHSLSLASDGPAKWAVTASELLLSGPLTLVVTGWSGSNASYSGTINLTVVPEPDTIALMAAGLGVVGFVARRRQQKGKLQA